MKNIVSSPVAYVTIAGNFLCRMNGKVIYINSGGEYWPSKFEKDKLLPNTEEEWTYAETWGKELIFLNPKQISWVEKAFIKREKYLNARMSAINYISPLELNNLADLSPDQFFDKVMAWFKHFVVSLENKKFRDKIGFMIFGGPLYLVNRLNVEQKDQILKSFRVFNPDLSKDLEKLVKLVESNNGNSKRTIFNNLPEAKEKVKLLKEASVN